MFFLIDLDTISHSGQTGFDLNYTLSAIVIKESLCHR